VNLGCVDPYPAVALVAGVYVILPVYEIEVIKQEISVNDAKDKIEVSAGQDAGHQEAPLLWYGMAAIVRDINKKTSRAIRTTRGIKARSCLSEGNFHLH
jgi:hypothetical protein